VVYQPEGIVRDDLFELVLGRSGASDVRRARVGANRQPAGSTEGPRLASAYAFGAVCPSRRKAAALIMPICNTAAMNHHHSEISSQVAADAHAVVILDRAGWHRSQGLVVPDNITC
jgi:hypothetical protein